MKFAEISLFNVEFEYNLIIDKLHSNLKEKPTLKVDFR